MGKKCLAPMTTVQNVSMSVHPFPHTLVEKHKLRSPCPSNSATVSTSSSLNSEMSQKGLNGEGGCVNDVVDFDDGNDDASNEVDEDNFMNSLALFYLQMQAKMLLPTSVIQKLISGFQDLHSPSSKYIA